MSKSTDYHDYVFNEGKLVGDFEGMYQNASGIPWHQDEQGEWVDVRLLRALMHDIPRFDKIVDFGAGLGYYLDILRVAYGNEQCECRGFDVSVTACEKASELFPEYSFQHLDLTEPRAQSPEPRAQSPEPRIGAFS